MISSSLKAIKVCEQNRETIENALAARNGKATSHTFSSYPQIENLARAAEQKAMKLLGTKKSILGVTAGAISGSSVPNAYKYSRTGTRVVFERRTSGWFLTAIESARLYESGGHGVVLYFTQEHDTRAINMLRRQYIPLHAAQGPDICT